MMGALSLLFRQLGTLWQHFGINQKVSIILALLVTVAAIGTIVYTSSRPDFRLLYSGMTLEDAARARELLEDERISVQLRNNGHALHVPAGDVYRARLLLATAGLPGDASTGLELFEQPKFGLTEFAQQVNYQRALQGELERTIVSIDGVQAARVMLVMPRDRLFATEQDKSGSASIMLTLRRGAQISPHQVMSINQLVSSAVPGLSEGHVTITDQSGRLLSDPRHQEDHALGMPRRQMDIQRSVEEELTRKAQDMLDLAIGPGQSIVRVSADLDFRQIERFNETFDPEARIVIRETVSTENSSEPITLAGAGMARVAVGTPADIMIEQAMGQLRREDVDTEYRVPSGRETIVDRGGRIARLSVSVSVAQGAEPRSAEAMQQIERMVRSAVGYSAERRDSVEVLEMAFAPMSDPSHVTGWRWWELVPVAPGTALRTLMGIALLLTLYIMSRKALRQLNVQREEVGVPVSELSEHRKEEEEEEAPQLPQYDPFAEAGEEFNEIEYVKRLADHDPAAISTWIEQAVRSAVKS